MPSLFGIIANHLSAGLLPWYLAAILVVMFLMCEALNKKTAHCVKTTGLAGGLY